MASKKSILVAALMAIGALTAPAQDISGNLSVFCGATSIVITNATGCKAPYPYTGQIVNPGAYSFDTNQLPRHHGLRPVYTGEWITETEADLVDGICCIPFFWGQWWQNWGPANCFQTAPTRCCLTTTSVTVTTWRAAPMASSLPRYRTGGAGPITDAATACRAYAEGLLYQDLTEDMIIGQYQNGPVPAPCRPSWAMAAQKAGAAWAGAAATVNGERSGPLDTSMSRAGGTYHLRGAHLLFFLANLQRLDR